MLDVKSGSGAFMKTAEQAREFAAAMVDIGTAHGLRTTAVLTDMSVPLGRAVGNALEVAESVEVLRGGGPPDVVTLTVVLAEEMLALAGIDADPAKVLASGAAYPVWEAMIAAQGGDPSAPLPVATHVEELRAERAGVIVRCDALAVGLAAWRLGAGRARKERAVQAAAGIRLLAGMGDTVEAGQPLLELHTDTPDAVPGALAALDGGVVVADSPAPGAPRSSATPCVPDAENGRAAQSSEPIRRECRSSAVDRRSITRRGRRPPARCAPPTSRSLT